MASLSSVSVTAVGVIPTAVVPTALDTIGAGQFGPTGVYLRVTNASGSPNTVTVLDPTKSTLGNPGTPPGVVVANAQAKQIFIPLTAIDPATQVATITNSAPAVGLSVEVARV